MPEDKKTNNGLLGFVEAKKKENASNAQAKTVDQFGTYVRTDVKFDEYYKHLKTGEGMITGGDTPQELEARIGRNQSAFSKWSRANRSLVTHVGLGLVEMVGYAAELPEIIEGSSDFSNAITEWVTKAKDAHTPILNPKVYRQNPDKLICEWLENINCSEFILN